MLGLKVGKISIGREGKEYCKDEQEKLGKSKRGKEHYVIGGRIRVK